MIQSMWLSKAFMLPLLGSFCLAEGYMPPAINGVTKLHSACDRGLSITYKENHICETTPGITPYSGYINLPSTSLAKSSLSSSTNYNISLFYWYFPARKPRPAHPKTPAPLVLWLGGGPGQSSIYGATEENGPCYINADGNSTTLNRWSFNRHANVLYIDTPVGTGYSYSELVEGVLDQTSQTFVPGADKDTTFHPNITDIPGRLSNPAPLLTANTTNTQVRMLWNGLQLWMKEFPFYDSGANGHKINIWGNSYAGYTGTALMAYFLSQNALIAKGSLSNRNGELTEIIPDHLGMTNAFYDGAIQGPGWLDYALNNTYGLEIISEQIYEEGRQNFYGSGGCLEAVYQCRALAAQGDPQGYGNNETVNGACYGAVGKCVFLLAIPETFANRSSFDISHLLPDPFPGYESIDFFNRDWVQRALGTNSNFTYDPNVVSNNFFSTGDVLRQDKSHVEMLLRNGVQFAMVHGDRDSRCNWFGGEDLSLNLSYIGTDKFRKSGYTPIKTNGSYSGGFVRQYEGFSFSRVFEAGHSAGTFQPETVYRIFMRSLFDVDVATGKEQIKGYQSHGPNSVRDVRNKLPLSPPVHCNIWSIPTTCTTNQMEALANGSAVVRDSIVVKPAE